MTVTSALRRVLAHPVLVLAGVLIGVLVAAAVSWATPRVYVASASVYVAGTDTARAPDTMASVLLGQQRMASYGDLASSTDVVGPAAARASVPGGSVTAAANPNSTVLAVTATAPDPAGAAALANAAAARFGEVLSEVERPRTPGGVPTVSATIVGPAVAPVEPTSPRTTLNLLAGALVGLVAAVGLVVYRGVTDRSVRDLDTLAALVGAPALGALPPPADETTPGRDQGYSDAVRRLRARLSLPADGGPRVVVLAAADPGAGTTTTVCELARVLARSGRVLAVDADLRRPGLAGWFGTADSPGLVDVLSGARSAGDVVRTVDDVDVVAAGSTTADPDALLASPAAAGLVQGWRAEYDRVLIDGAPLGPVVDSAVVARHADGVVLVAREGATRGDAVTAASRTLREAGVDVLGVVLTGASASPRTYGHRPDRSEPAVARVGHGSHGGSR